MASSASTSAVALALLLLLLLADASAAWEQLANCNLAPSWLCEDDCTKRGHWWLTCDYACAYCTSTYIGGGFAVAPDDDHAKTIQNFLAPAAAPAFARKLRLQ